MNKRIAIPDGKWSFYVPILGIANNLLLLKW